VARTVVRLRRGEFDAMGREITTRRLKWLDAYLAQRGVFVPFTPREAFEALFFQQMGLDPRDLPAVSESADRIVWESRNRCPLLDACLALDMDTRRVCRRVNERATQAFFSRLDPQLRFHRSYIEIRPHSDLCREWITRVNFAEHLQAAAAEGGAIVVMDGRVAGVANTVCSDDSPAASHGAWRALRHAQACLEDDSLCGTILFSSAEVCPECGSLAVRLNVTTIVFAASPEQDRVAEPSDRQSKWRGVGLGSGPIEIICVDSVGGRSVRRQSRHAPPRRPWRVLS
jgi:tRNA(Arg) A34 adenosine deaminase TadA